MPPKKVGTKRKAATSQTSKKAAPAITPEQAFEQAFYSASSSDDSDDDGGSFRDRLTTRGTLKKKRNHKPKRPKTAEPQAPDLSDHDLPVDDEIVSEQQLTITKMVATKITTGLNGPELSINLTDIFANNSVSLSHLLETSDLKNLAPSQESSAKIPSLASFINLPSELSIKIYRELFVGTEPIIFHQRKSFKRSAQFLATCRKINEEGTVILYGENSFHFARAHQTRGKYWEEVWKEIGYKDVRRFLHDIGPHNIGKLRYVSMEFEDALPTLTLYLDSESRKYCNDPVLTEVLKMLGKNAVLQRFAVGYRGRCNLCERDYHFLKALCTIQCYEYASDQKRQYSRIHFSTNTTLKKLIEKPATAGSVVDKTKRRNVPKMLLGNIGW